MKKRFTTQTLAGLKATKYMRIRAGDHRFIPIWVVVVGERVIVRSWNNKPDGWYRAFLSHPDGQVQICDRKVAIRAVVVRSKQLNDAADEGYAAKYRTRANASYVVGFKTPERRVTTLELIPA
jgi:hypothetical protein